MITFSYKFKAPNLKAVEKSIQTGLARGLNEGGDKVRTQVQRTLKVQTGLSKYSSVTSRMKESGRGYNRAVPGKMAYAIVATGHGIPIKEFPVSATGKGVSARVWGVAHLFKRSFEIKGRGVSGFRARLGAERTPIRTLYGPSLSKELTKDKSLEVFYASTKAFVPVTVLKHLLKAIG